MSDLPAKNFSPSILRVGDLPAESKSSSYAPRRADSAPAPAATRTDFSARATLVVTAAPMMTVGKLSGFFLLLAGVLLATISFETWTRLIWWAPAQLTTETYRWISVGALAVAGLLFVSTRAIAVVLSCVFLAVTAYCADRLLQGRVSGFLTGYLGADSPRYVLAIGALVFGYWIQAVSTGQIRVRGVLGLALTVLAAFGVLHNWYDWSPIAERLGPGVIKVLKERGPEVTWATVLVLTALGVSSSRTRPIHFLIAVLLGALAYYCVREGYSQMHTFTFHRGETRVSVESLSYSNVEAWRWIVAAELTLLAAILLHLAAGVGGLSMAMALGWMLSALAVYGSVGNMALIRAASDAFGTSQTGVAPLSNMGIPISQVPPAQRVGPNTPVSRTNVVVVPPQGPVQTATTPNPEFDRVTRQAILREIVPMAWMFLTAVLAGIIAVGGFNLLAGHEGHRSLFNSFLWFAFGIALTAFLWMWPRDADRSWEAWFASWRMSRYHTHTIWLMFLGTMAVASTISLAGPRRAANWVHLAAAAAFLGTAASLVTVAILIYFGGFSPLPSWIYVVVAVVQSSLGWILLTHHSFARWPSSPRITA